MKHAGIKTGCISTSLASRSFPLDPRHVNHNPHVALVQVVADIRLLLGQHHRPLEEVLASEHTKNGFFLKCKVNILKVSNIVDLNYTPFASINSIVQSIRLVPTYWTIISRSGVDLRRGIF